MQGGIGLDSEERRHIDAARTADPRQIVAHQIDDHQIFGPLLFVGDEGGLLRGVGHRIGAPPRGALHRPRGRQPVANLQKKLRRGRKNIHLPGAHQGRVGARLAAAQSRIEAQGIALIGETQGMGQIDLIKITRPDQAERLAHPVFVAGPRRLRVKTAKGRGRRSGGEHGVNLGRLQHQRRPEQAEPKQRPARGLGV